MNARPLVIAAIDNSAAARPVIATAMALAPVLGATVNAVHVSTLDRDADGDGETARACAASFDLPLRIVPGDPLTQLITLTKPDDVVALVIGARALPGGRRPAGHLALALASALDKPLVVVPPNAEPRDRLESVLLAIKGAPNKVRALRRTVDLVHAAHLQITAVHVDDEASIPSFSDQVQHETEAYTKEFLARYLTGAPDAQLELRVGVPADEIIAVAESLDPEMIAVGWPHVDDPTRGRVAKEILDRSRVPVMLVAVV